MKKRKGADQLLAVALSASMVVSMNAPIAAWADTGEESSAAVGSQVAETEPVVPVEEQVADSTAEPTVESPEVVDVVKTTETPVAFAAGETQNATAVATIDGIAYDTLAAAIAAVPDSGATPTTITLNSDAAGEVKINGDKNIILDLNSHTYNAVQGVGSTGTETNGMQLIKGSTVVIKNGTMTASANAGLHFMIKNYGDLTLENVVVQASGLGNGDSTVNNCGNLTVRGANARIAAPQDGYAVTTGNYVVGTHPRTVIEAGTIDSVYTEGSFWEASGAGQDHSSSTVSTEITGGTIGSIGISYWDAAKDLAWTFDVGPDATIGTVNDFAANVGTGYYASLKDAIAAAQPGDTVTLTNDVQLSRSGDALQVSGADKSIVLDLNGKSIVADETIGAKVTDGAKLTVRDSAEGGKIQLVKYGFEVVGDTKYTDGSKPDPSNAVSSTLTLEGGTIANSGGYAATVYPYGNGATLNVTGGTIENTYANGAVDGGFAVSGNGTRNGTLDRGGIAVNVTGGTIKSVQDCAVYLPGYGDVSITGGTVEGWTGIEIDSGNLSIGGDAVVKSTYQGDGTRKYKTSGDGNYNFGAALAVVSKGSQAATGYYGHMNIDIAGGTLESASYYAIDEYNLAHVQDNAKASTPYIDSLAITGGTFKGSVGAILSDNMTGFVTGGTYSSDPAAYIPAGYETTQTVDSMWEVAAVAVAKVGDIEYASLQDAIDATADGQAISLIANATENVTVPATANCTLDLAGYTLNGGTVASKAALTNNGTLVIKDSVGGGAVKRNDSQTAGYYVVDNQGTMTVDGGSFSNNSGFYDEAKNTWSAASLVRNGGVAADRANTLIVNGGTFEQPGFIVVKNDDYGKLTVNGGTFRTQDQTYTQKDGVQATSVNSAIQNWGQATVSGGDIQGALWVDTWSNDLPSSEMTVGGNVRFKGKVVMGSYASQHGISKQAILKVTGGTFDVESWSVPSEAALVSLTGGTYSAQIPAGYVADGYLVEPDAGNTTYTVKKASETENKVQVVDKDGNATGAAKSVSEVVAEVQKSGGSLVLAGDVAETSGITIPAPQVGTEAKPVIIELNGNDVTASGTDAAVKVGEGAELVISDAKGSGVISSTSTQAPAVEVAGTVTLDGATVTSSSNDGIKVAAGATLTVKSGVVEAKAATPKLEYRSARSAAPGQYGISAVGEQGKTTTLNIEGGKISGEAGALSIGQNVNCSVKGGVFNSDVSQYMDSQNYKQTEANGLYYVAPNATNAYNVAQFKTNAADPSTWTAPTAPSGQTFAGWYADSQYGTPSTATEGTAYAKFVNIADVMKFKGGSLRMDATPSVSEGLRFGYSLFLPEEMQFVSSGWKYTIKGTDYTKVAEHQALYDSGVIDTNLVFLNVPKNDYAEDISVEMYVTYKTSDGTTVTFKEPTAQIRSVNKVAQFILDSPNASAEEKEYAQKILA